jgi:hypothetical protein
VTIRLKTKESYAFFEKRRPLTRRRRLACRDWGAVPGPKTRYLPLENIAMSLLEFHYCFPHFLCCLAFQRLANVILFLP